MAQQADGTVYINSSIDTDGFTAGGKEIEAAARRAAKTVKGIGDAARIALEKQTAAFVKSNQLYAQQEQKVQDLQNKLEEMAGQTVETEAFKSLTKELDSAEKKLDTFYGNLRKIETSKGLISSATIKNTEKDIDALREKIQQLYVQRTNVSGGKLSNVNAEIDKYQEQINSLNKKLADMKSKNEQIKNSYPYKNATEQIDIYNQKVDELREKIKELRTSGKDYQPVDTSAFTDKLITEQQRLQQMGEVLNVSYDSLKSKVEQYGGSIAGTAQKHGLLQKALSSVAGAAKKAGAAILALHKNTKKSNGSVGTGIKNMLKYTLGISSLLVLIKKIKSAVKEGMQNLAQYSDETNTHLSALKSSITQLKNSLATAFNPILTVIEPILTQFINLLSQAATYVGMFFSALTGQNTFTKAVAVWEDYANSIGEAADNAKKALKYLSGLDEIRTYTSDSDSSGGAGGVSPADMFETVPIESKIKEFADKIKQTLSEMFAPLQEAWNKYGAPIVDKLRKIKDRFVEFGAKIADSTLKWFADLDWEPFLQSVDELLVELEPLVDLILNGLSEAYENVLLPLGKWTIEKGLPSLLNAVADGLRTITDILTELEPVITWVFNEALIPYGEAAGKVISGIKDAFIGLKEQVVGVFTGDWERAFQGMQQQTEGFKNAILAVFNFINHIVLPNFVKLFRFILENDWSNSFGIIGEKIEEAKNLFVVFSNFAKRIMSGLIQFINGIFSKDWKNAWSGIKSIILSTWILIKSATIKTWNEISSNIKKSVNVIIGFMNLMINGIVSGINLLINGLNAIKIEIPNWSPIYAGKSFKINIPTITASQIPYLATGAVIPPNAPFAAVLGDQKHGNNIEAPENLLRRIVREEGGGQGFYGTIRVPVIMNGRQIMEAVVDAAKLQQTVSGNNPLALT